MELKFKKKVSLTYINIKNDKNGVMYISNKTKNNEVLIFNLLTLKHVKK